MKIVYLAAVLLLAGTVSCTPDHKIIELPEWMPDINIPEIIGNIREVIGQILDILGINLPEITLPEISLKQIFERILEALGFELSEIDWENLTLEKILEILGINLPDVDWENITLEEILEIIITRIQEIIEGIELPEININTPIRGTAVSITNHPSIVQVDIGTGPIWIQGCVASIITNYHVLGHSGCFTGALYSPNRRRVRAGASSRNTGGYIMEVDFAINNEEISVIRLTNSLLFTDSVQPINIIAQDFVIPPGSAVIAAGWGKTTKGRVSFSDKDLNQIDLTVVDRDACAERWSRKSREVTTTHICAGRPETGGRDGDILDRGVPLYFQNILIGVQSFGKFIGNQNYPLVLINVASYTNFIVGAAN